MESMWNFTSWIGIDPAFSSSQFGICIVQWRDDKLNVVYTELLDKSLYTDALHLIRQLIQSYAPCKVFIDGSAAHLDSRIETWISRVYQI